MVRRLAVLAIALSAAMSACSPTAPSPGQSPGGLATASSTLQATPTPAPTVDRVAGWRSDLALLVPGMDRLHPDLGHGTPVGELEAAADEVAAGVPGLTNDQLLVSVLRVVAMVSAHGCDAHTGAFIWGTGTYP